MSEQLTVEKVREYLEPVLMPGRFLEDSDVPEGGMITAVFELYGRFRFGIARDGVCALIEVLPPLEGEEREAFVEYVRSELETLGKSPDLISDHRIDDMRCAVTEFGILTVERFEHLLRFFNWDGVKRSPTDMPTV